jgi:transcriptional regulator with XRE-family HTH domain
MGRHDNRQRKFPQIHTLQQALQLGTLADRARACREVLDITQQELADEAGTNQAVVQKIENGKSKQPRILPDYAAALGVPVAALHYGKQESIDAYQFYADAPALFAANDA